MAYGAHRDSASDYSETVLTKDLSLIAGGIATVIALPIGYGAVMLTLGLLPKLFSIAVALVFAFFALRFWLGDFRKDKMSTNDLARLFAPWVDHDPTSKKVIAKPLVLALGVVLGAVAIWLVVSAIGTTIAVLFTLLLIAALVYVVGIVGWFWKSQAWKDGLTENEIRDMVTWPASI
jgi:hypothetical protein